MYVVAMEFFSICNSTHSSLPFLPVFTSLLFLCHASLKIYKRFPVLYFLCLIKVSPGNCYAWKDATPSQKKEEIPKLWVWWVLNWNSLYRIVLWWKRNYIVDYVAFFSFVVWNKNYFFYFSMQRNEWLSCCTRNLF